MILDILVIAISLYAFIYVIITAVITIGEKRLKPCELSSELPNVSVVICARNEEKNIRRCLDSLMRLDYPGDKLEILLVDDESEDSTMDIFNEYTKRYTAFRVLSTAGEPHDLPAKQRPLNLGICQSTGEIVLVTDADIAVRPGWIKGHLSAYHDRIGIVGGTTRVDVSSGRIFDRIQCCDLITKHAFAMGCAGLGFPLTIMGNNFSFRRDTYNQVGGFMGMGYSIVEDMALMNAIVKRTKYTLGWITEKHGVVVSTPETDLNAFVEQRRRWVNEIGDLSMIGKVIITVETLMISAFITSLIIAPWNPKPLAVTVIAWVFGYFIMLTSSPGNEKNDILYIPGMLIFQMVYGVILGWRNVFGNKIVLWKGREYEKTI